MGKFFKRLSKSYTDRLYFLNLAMAWLFTIWCNVLTIFGDNWGVQDYSIIVYGLPLVWAELGVHTGFVIWKAKAENINKYNMEALKDGMDCE